MIDEDDGKSTRYNMTYCPHKNYHEQLLTLMLR